MAQVNDSDAFEDITQGNQKQQKPRQKQVLPTSLLKLIVALVAVIVVVVVVVVAVTASKGGDDPAEYQNYMSSVASILKKSDAIGLKLVKLLTDPGDTNRKDIQTKLDQYVRESTQLDTEAQALQAPKAMIEQNVHQFFLMVMTFRHNGLVNLQPSLMNALDTQDSDVVVDQISESLYYLTNADFLYKEVFVTKATAVLKERNLQGVTVPDSKFLGDPDLASKSQAQQMIAQLKSTGYLQAVHGVALDKVVAQPDNQQIKAGQTYNLTASDELAFLVTVENQGNMPEKDVPVVITLQGGDGADAQEKTVTIPEIKPGAKVTATVEGMDATAYGDVATFKVMVGPVTGERFKDNNSMEANVIFKL